RCVQGHDLRLRRTGRPLRGRRPAGGSLAPSKERSGPPRSHPLSRGRLCRANGIGGSMRILSVGLVISAIHLSMPLIYPAIGGVFSESSGVINIALEGMMLFGAFIGVAVTWWTKDPFVGLAAAIAVGLLLGALHAFFALTVRADQIISATAINLLALGLTAALIAPIWGAPGVSPSVKSIHPLGAPGFIRHIPYVGRTLVS